VICFQLAIDVLDDAAFRTAGTKVEAFSLHPGAIVTNGLQHLKVLKYVLEPLLYPFSKSLAQVWHHQTRPGLMAY